MQTTTIMTTPTTQKCHTLRRIYIIHVYISLIYIMHIIYYIPMYNYMSLSKVKIDDLLITLWITYYKSRYRRQQNIWAWKESPKVWIWSYLNQTYPLWISAELNHNDHSPWTRSYLPVLIDLQVGLLLTAFWNE